MPRGKGADGRGPARDSRARLGPAPGSIGPAAVAAAAPGPKEVNWDVNSRGRKGRREVSGALGRLVNQRCHYRRGARARPAIIISAAAAAAAAASCAREADIAARHRRRRQRWREEAEEEGEAAALPRAPLCAPAALRRRRDVNRDKNSGAGAVKLADN